jgi:hypothetical protein
LSLEKDSSFASFKTNNIIAAVKITVVGERLMTPLNRNDLELLREMALEEHQRFFERNPHLKNTYYGSLIGICLCQGAASHYLNPTVGIKDFDIWHFYKQNADVNFPYRAHKRIESGYKNKPIDFLKRAVPRNIFDFGPNQPEWIIMKYLSERKSPLLKKAIIGLYPDVLFGRTLWRGEL